VTSRPRLSLAARTYRTTDGGGRNIDPVSQLGRFDMRINPRNSADERRQAARSVAHNATDGAGRWGDTATGAAPGPYKADALELLQALGLDQP
jgi:hypothetical protein